VACPVCFGQSDSPMAAAMNMGIWVMLAVVGGMLTAFASFFVYLMRRAKRTAQGSLAGARYPSPAADAREGTAQC
jgi:hypothetical protein